MKREWRRTETRTVRPFLTVSESLDGVRLRLSPTQDYDERTSFDVRDADLRDIRPEFQLGIDVAALEIASPGVRESFEFVIRVTDARLRRSELVLKCGLGELPVSWELPREVRDRLAWKAGVDVTVALVLKADRPLQPGGPFLRGHWIARKDFSVRAQAELRSFPVERWSGEDFARLGLPRDTAYWIQFNTEDFNRRFEDPAEAFRLYLRADVYDALVDAQDTGPGRAVASLIFSEIVTDVLWNGLRDLGHGEEIVRGGVLHTLLDKVKKATGMTGERLIAIVKEEKDRPKLRAIVQATLGSRKAIVKVSSRT